MKKRWVFAEEGWREKGGGGELSVRAQGVSGVARGRTGGVPSVVETQCYAWSDTQLGARGGCVRDWWLAGHVSMS